jgi:flagellar basal-body rod modification protein FlgD
LSSVTTVGSTTSTAATAKTTSTTISNSLGQADFLKILVAEMQYQDPTNPTSNTEYVAQLAQFSMLEQMQTITDAINSSNLLQSAGIIGKTVTASDGSQTITGTVDSIVVEDSVPYAVIGEDMVPVSLITSIS